MKYQNEADAIRWVSVLLARRSGIEMGPRFVHPDRLYVGEIIDHSRTELSELGSRVFAWRAYGPGPFRERIG